MNMIPKDIQNAYQSARLGYTRIDSDDVGFNAFVAHIFKNPTLHALSNPSSMLMPGSKSEVDGCISSMAKSLLGVAMCLLPSEELQEPHKPDAQDAGKGKGIKDNKEEAKKPAIIGFIVLGWGGQRPDHIHNRNASIGITIDTPYQNKGYGREAINWMLDWAFKHASLHSVSIGTAAFNRRAAYLYEDIGFVPEGRRREVLWFNREWHDDLLFSMTENDWEALRGIKPGV